VSLLRSAVDEWAVEDIATKPPGLIADDLAEIETNIGRLELERARRLRILNQARAWNEVGYTSGAAFLIHRCRIAAGRAIRLVAQANSLAEMPQTSVAWRTENLSADQVRQLVLAHDTNPDVFSEHEKTLVAAVEPLGTFDTARAVTYWRQIVNEPNFEKDAARLHDLRRVHLSQTFEGMGRLDGWLDPEAYEVVRAALDAATPPPAEADGRSPAQRRADALVDVARHALDHGDLPDRGGERPHLMVMVDLDQLTGEGHGISETIDGTVLTRSTVQRLACDASISRIVMGPNSEPLDVGRKTRVIPPALRRAVIARDRHCRHPGCYRPARWCDVDHIIPWLDGGETKLENLQLLCRYHHMEKHKQFTSAARMTSEAARRRERGSISHVGSCGRDAMTRKIRCQVQDERLDSFVNSKC
jgi:hypothetical protein